MQNASADTTAPTGDEGFLTAREAARLLRVDIRTIYRNAESLGAVRVGDLLRIPRATLVPRQVLP